MEWLIPVIVLGPLLVWILWMMFTEPREDNIKEYDALDNPIMKCILWVVRKFKG